MPLPVPEVIPVVCCLGRFGDVMNALPIAYDLSRKGPKPKFVIAREFFNILDGVSYVSPVVWDVPYSSIPRAVQRLEGKHEIICQSYTHPDNRHLTESYQKESWRVAGWLERFGSIPLVFDLRDKDRELNLMVKIASVNTAFDPAKKTILVAGKSVSSPFKWNLHEVISKHFPDVNVIDLGRVSAERIYDFLGPIEGASLLVTVDTSFLHLARATQTPIVAIINEGWFGSIPPPNTRQTLRYHQASPESVIEAITKSL